MCQNNPTQRGIEIIYNIFYSKCSIYSQVVHVSNGRGISYVSRIHKKETCGDYFWEVVDIDRSHAWECNTVLGTRGFHSVRSSDNPVFEIWTRKSLVFARLAVMVTGMCVNHWIGLMDGIAYHFHLISVQLLS